eukprot:3199569-Pyramimonas_sp.AAC.1
MRSSQSSPTRENWLGKLLSSSVFGRQGSHIDHLPWHGPGSRQSSRGTENPNEDVQAQGQAPSTSSQAKTVQEGFA